MRDIRYNILQNTIKISLGLIGGMWLHKKVSFYIWDHKKNVHIAGFQMIYKE